MDLLRGNRHLIELGLAMMFQSHLPLHYWVEAFFTSTYISNLLPAVDNDNVNKSPFDIMFGRKPKYSALRVFGSACFPCLRHVTSHKFEGPLWP